MRIMILPAILATTLLTGCMTAQERVAQRSVQDDTKCLTYGAQRGTPAYVQCRTQLDTTRTMANAVEDAAPIAAPAYRAPPAPVTCLRTGAMVTCN